MILADTSVWVDHLRKSNSALFSLLDHGRIACHPLIVGELACGNMRNRREILALLQTLPQTEIATNEEALLFIDTHQLMGKGLGLIDIHLLAAARMSGFPLWTLDLKLRQSARQLHLSYSAGSTE